MAEPLKIAGRWVWAKDYVRTAVKLFFGLVALLLVYIGFQNLIWVNRDVIGYAIMNPGNVRKLEGILDNKQNQAVNDTFSSFPQSVK